MTNYIKFADAFMICHSFDIDFNEEKIKKVFNYVIKWLLTIEMYAPKKTVFLVGCKYEVKVQTDYLVGHKVSALMFQNENLTSFGERVI